MTILAVAIIRVLAFVILLFGVVITALTVFGASSLVPALQRLPQASTGLPILLITFLTVIMMLLFSFSSWAFLICIASITDDLHDIRFRQR